MIVDHYNTFPHGGAAEAARRLHAGLLRQNVESRFYYLRSDIPVPEREGLHQLSFDRPPAPARQMVQRLRHRIRRSRQRRIYRLYDQHLANRDASCETFSMAELPEATSLAWSDRESEVLHLHWISFLADYPSFFGSIPDRFPIVWTLHDMNPLTGGCHYSRGCNRYQNGCGSCPQVHNPGLKDVSSASFRAKRAALARKNIHVVAPSQWLTRLAMSSGVWPKQTTFRTIHYGLDLELFQPVPREVARRRLGIETESFLLGFGADDVSNQRKGMSELLAALPQVNASRPIAGVVFGGGEIPKSSGLPPLQQLGYIRDPEKLALVYAAVDAVVVPSREDNQPNVGLEAMACGRPVVAYDAGGIPEIVRNGVTGLIARAGDTVELANKIRLLADNPDTVRLMGNRARMMMEAEFEIQRQSQQYVALYEQLLSASRRKIA